MITNTDKWDTHTVTLSISFIKFSENSKEIMNENSSSFFPTVRCFLLEWGLAGEIPIYVFMNEVIFGRTHDFLLHRITHLKAILWKNIKILNKNAVKSERNRTFEFSYLCVLYNEKYNQF